MAMKPGAAAEKWLNDLDDDRLGDILTDIGTMKPEERRSAMADPLKVFQRAGFSRLPEGATVKIIQKTAGNLFDQPLQRKIEDLLRGKLRTRLRFYCFEVCISVPVIVGGEIIGFRRICRLVCRRL